MDCRIDISRVLFLFVYGRQLYFRGAATKRIILKFETTDWHEENTAT